MKTITLLKMRVANFKGIHSKEIDFSHLTRITGGNATCKSTIYEAYLWCLFGKSASGGDPTVQPLDQRGEPIHKTTTEVELHLSVDGSPFILKRQLEEDWVKPRGVKEEVLKGLKTTFFVNDVPCKASEYSDKINAIFPAADWMMVSNIATFNSLTTADKRRQLNDAAKHVTDAIVAAEGFPHITQALNENKTIEEFRREICAKRKKSKIELDEIPARIDQQEKLRITDLDFNALKTRSIEIEKEIAQIDTKLQAEVSEQATAAVDNLSREYSELSESKTEIESSLINDLGNKHSTLDAKIREIATRKAKHADTYNQHKSEIEKLEKEKSGFNARLCELRKNWTYVNESAYVEGPTENECPCCDRPYTAVDLATMQSTAIERFNAYKLRQLGEIEREATNIDTSIRATVNSINETTKEATRIKAELSAIDSEEATVLREKEYLPTVDVLKEAHREYQKIIQNMSALRIAMQAVSSTPKPDNAALNERKTELQTELKSVQSLLGKEAGNANIDAEKVKLEKQAETLAQALTDMDLINFEIDNFLKRKITLIEEAVSSNFSIVRWKLFESNLTNDGERPICEALVNGVPYAQLNTAMRINAGIDICTGLSKAFSISAPLFVDNKESVTELLPITQQLITLEVVAGQELTIINQ